MKFRGNLLSLASSELIKPERFNALKDKYKARYGRVTTGAVNNALAFDGQTEPVNMSYSDYVNAKRQIIENNKDNYNA